MTYFVVDQEANVETPCAAAGGGAVGDQRRGTTSTVVGCQSRRNRTFREDPLLDHKAKSRKQQQAQDDSLEGCLVDPSKQDDTYSRSGSQGGQSNAKIDQNL